MELKGGEYAKAAGHLQAAHEIRPNDAAAAFDEGQALQKLENFAGARDALESSLKLAPEQLEARLLLGRVYLELNDPKAAEDQFEAATLLDSKDVDAQLGIAQCEIAQGNQSTALEQLKSLSAAHPHNAEVFDLLAKTYRSVGNNKDAAQAGARARVLRKKEAGKI
jgi:Flp pilus assembly protein TadD